MDRIDDLMILFNVVLEEVGHLYDNEAHYLI